MYLITGTIALIVDLITILHGYGISVVDQIRQNLVQTDTNATGKTSKSLRYEVVDNGSKVTLKVIGKPYFKVVETGRKATPQYTNPSKQFVDSIREWVKARGIPESAAYAIAKSIHKKGTPPTGKEIFSNVINGSLTDKISKDLLDKFAIALTNNIVNQYVGNSN